MQQRRGHNAVVWISVDELLEKVMLKLYKRWDAGALARLRPWLDEERLRLGTTLRSLASAHITQSEDEIVLFLERLAGQEPIVALAGDELAPLGDVKQMLMRARRPGGRLRGFRPKPTNLTPVRLQTLLTLLEAVEPPAYAVTRMYLPGGGEELAELLEYVVVQIYGNWSRLAVETRDAVLRTLNTVRAGMVQEGDQVTVNVRNVVETLHLFEAMPETLHFACHAFLAGKIDAAPETPPQLYSQTPISDQLAELLTHPMPLAGGPPNGREPALPGRDLQTQERVQPIVTTTPEPAAELPAETPAEPAVEAAPAPVSESPAAAAPVVAPPPVAEGPVQPAPPRLAREEVRPAAAVTERQFYTDVRFPQQVRVGDEVPLIVRLTRSPFAASRAAGEVGIDFERLDRPEYVEVVVVATGFNEATATWSRTVAVYSDRDSQPAIFLLRAGRELGNKRVTVDFYHKARYVGSAAFVTKVVDRAPAAVAGVTVEGSDLVARLLDEPPPPADLELRIVRGGSDNILSFMLHSTKAGVGYHWRPMGQVRLNAANPQAYLETIFAHLSQAAAQPENELSEGDIEVNPAQIAEIGRQLFRELFPPELQHEYWTRIRPRRRDSAQPDGSIETLLITSDEPWIPWELVKPYRTDPESGAEQSDGFLCESFQVSRWLAGRGLVETVHVQAAALVDPGAGSPYSQREERFFQALADRQVQVSDPLRSAAEVRQRVQAGDVQLLHVAARGRQGGTNGAASPFALADGSLTPNDFTGDRAAGLRMARPLLVLSVCHSARAGFALTGLGNWVERLVDEGLVSALVGTLWEVNDLLAAEFTLAFYDRLLAGDTVGRAFHAARLHLRDRQPGNSTWLAYVLYADPNSAVYWGRAGEVAAAEPEPLPAPEPEPEPEPALDLDDLRAVLEATLTGSLSELVSRSIPAAVATALELWATPEGGTPAVAESAGEPPAAEELAVEEAAAGEPVSEESTAEKPPAEDQPVEEPPAPQAVAEPPPPAEPAPTEEAAADAPPSTVPPEPPAQEASALGGEAETSPEPSAPAEEPPADAPAPDEPANSQAAAPLHPDLSAWMPADWLSAREAELRAQSESAWPEGAEAGTAEEIEPPAQDAEEDAPDKDG